MTQRKNGAQQANSRGRLDAISFGSKELWIGRHEADQDVLIFDPAQGDPSAQMLSLYSLTQHRMRRFPRSIVLDRIHPVEDETSRQRAEKEYETRVVRREDHARAKTEEAARGRERQKEAVLAQHSRYLANLGLKDEGVRDTGPQYKTGRRTKCHVCGIAIDDFAGSACLVCEGILCSCGACACKQRQ